MIRTLYQILVLCTTVASLCFGSMWGCSNPSPTNETSPSDAGSQQASEKAPGEATSSAPEPGSSDAATTAELPPEEPKSSRYSFPNEEIKCKRNASFEELKSILQGGKNNPTGRGEQASAYDPCNKRVIVFGGNDLQPKQCADFGPTAFKNDTWIYVLEYKNWIRLKTPTAPPPRGRSAFAFDLSRKKFYIFGGRYRAQQSGGNYTMYNDLWAFDVNTDTWAKVPVTGTERPVPRANSAMVYDDLNDQIVMFGGNSSGNGLRFNALNDTWIYDLKRNKWRKVTTPTAPSIRLYHSMVMDGANKRILLYSGGGNNAFTGPFLNDMWAFNTDSNTWKKVWDRSMSRLPSPIARINSALVEDRARKRITMFAGHDDSSVGHRNDVWVFNSQNEWKRLNPGDTGTGAGCARFCACAPDFVKVDPNSPERREYQTFVPVIGEDRAILFGGKTDCGYIDDTWSLHLNTFKWTKVNDASKGEACKRTGRANCTELCY